MPSHSRLLPASFVLMIAGIIVPGARAALRAGAYAQDITPTQFPVLVNGGFVEAVATKANGALHARAVVLNDGRETIAIVVVDSCMLPRELLDDAKGRASKLTGIAVDRMLISATHTHTAPSSMGCLGSDADANYVKILPDLLARAIEQAHKRLAPAKIGWTSVVDAEHTACRRWVFRPDRMRKDPFGELTVRATMHPGYLSPDAVGPAGPIDPGLSIVSIRHADGRPLAVLANYSMHYVGTAPLSADYYGQYCDAIAKLLNADGEFVGIMSQGTSGDMWLADYSKPKPEKRDDIDSFAKALADETAAAIKTIRYAEDAPIVMRETTLKLRRRVPDEKRLAWAREAVAALGAKKPKAQPDIYAREAILLHDEPERELKLQAIRVGDVGIAAIPNEVYALSGLKIKAMSPLAATFTMGLANGSEGYIPPAEQHPLGGYTTWAARTAALEAGAETKIVEGMLKLLEDAAGKPRRDGAVAAGPYARAVLASKPFGYWRLAEFAPATAVDASGQGRHGGYEPGVLFYLPGPESAAFTGDAAVSSRAAHFAGGRVRAQLAKVAQTYTAEFWFWNGLAHDARPVTAYLFSRGADGDQAAPGDHLGIGGTHDGGVAQGKLLFFNGNEKNQLVVGRTPLELRTWYHVALVRDGDNVSVFLNGQPEISGRADVTATAASFFLGGRSDNFANLEGKLCEAAVYDRVLKPEEIAAHFKAAAITPAPVRADNQSAVGNPQSAIRSSTKPRSPADSLKALHLPPDLTVELVASEPLVADPVAIDWGADGKLWVVEMADYPYGMDGKGQAGGRIKYLESGKADGRYDKATLFMDGVKMPTGIIAWRKGVIVTAAPDIFYAEDTDGDGKADRREVLFTGFLNRNPQLRVNGLRWGLDNWLYVANGWSAGVVESAKTHQKLDLKGHDLRIRADTGEMELVGGVSQFGREMDDVGRWFGTDNAHPLFHYVLDDRYLRRNPHVSFPEPKQQLLPLPLPPVYPKSPFAKRYIGYDHHGHFTSACGISTYRDDLLFPPRELHAFICEPVHNLVQHQVLTESGTTFTARRVDGEAGADFLASEDPWFRPVMTRSGPDGALWVVDVYRYMIEHPDWLNPTGKAELAPFYRDGDDKGRIYRVYPKEGQPRAIPRLDRLSAEQLVAALDSPAGHTRDLAQRMLVWKNDATAAAHLERLFTDSKSPVARLHALCTLDGLAKLEPSMLLVALADQHPAVRTHALRLAEPLLDGNSAILQAACRLANDASPQVRQQLAYTLGQSGEPKALEAFKTVAAAVGSDTGLIFATLSSATGPRFGAAVELATAESPLLSPLLDAALATGDRGALAKLVSAIVPSDLAHPTAGAMDGFSSFLDKLAARRTTLEKLCESDDALGTRLKSSGALFDSARRIAADAKAPANLRTASVTLLGRQPAARAEELKLIPALLSPLQPAELQLAAIRAAARTRDPVVAPALLAGWANHSPAVRTAIADALLPREGWAFDLAQSAAARDLDFSRRQRLLNHASSKVKEAAKATLAQSAVNADRQKVIDGYQTSLTLPGDLKHGQAVYAEHCATCHRVGGAAVGHDLGPNLLSVRDWPRENLLAAILDPDRTVEPRFIAYAATLSDSTVLTGLLTAESAGNITIKTLDDVDHAVPRAGLKSLVSTNRSLMPQGFEAALAPQDLADLLAFIQSPGVAEQSRVGEVGGGPAR